MPLEPISQAALIAAGGSLASTGVQAAAGTVANRKSYKYSLKLAEHAYSKELEAWNMANAYNSPENQMARLKRAGLNPNLVYGSGTVSGNTSTSTPRYQAPQAKFNPVVPVDPLMVISSYFDIRQKEESVRLTEQTIKNQEVQQHIQQADLIMKTFQNALNDDTWNAQVQSIWSKATIDINRGAILGHEAFVAEEMNKLKLELQGLINDLTKEEIERVKSQIEEINAGLMYKNWGITSSDSPQLRMVGMLLNLLGIDSPNQKNEE